MGNLIYTDGFVRNTAIKMAGVQNAIKAKKLIDLGIFTRFRIWIGEKLLGKRFIRLELNKETILIKISNIQKLAIGKIEGITPKMFSGRYTLAPDLEKDTYNFVDLALKSQSLGAPMEQLLKSHREGTLGTFLEKANQVQANCLVTARKVEALVASFGGKVIDGVAGDSSKKEMTKEDLAAIEKETLILSQAFAVSPKDVSRETKKVGQWHIMAVPSKTSLKVIGLFGKLLGKGGDGVVTQTVDLSTGDLSHAGDHAVLKTKLAGQSLKTESGFFEGESNILFFFNVFGPILGIQREITPIPSFADTQIGPKYEGSVLQMIKRINALPIQERLGLVYQLMHGITFMHKRTVTHGDIKLGNIFIDLEPSPALFLADFGGAVCHKKGKIPKVETFTESYRHWQDQKEIQRINNSLDPRKSVQDDHLTESYQAVRQKADVFAACSVIYLILTSCWAYKLGSDDKPIWPMDQAFAISEDVRPYLSEEGLGMGFIDAIVKGLDHDHTKRPTAEMLFGVVGQSLKNADPKLFAKLEAQKTKNAALFT